jgi:4-alpha-glucanotransferase
LAGSVEDETRTAAKDRDALLALLRSVGLTTPASTDEEIVVAMHEFLARTPCRFVTASLYDVLGELDQPNLPGTVDEYPNWRMPLRMRLEDIVGDPRVATVATVLAGRKADPPSADPSSADPPSADPPSASPEEP